MLYCVCIYIGKGGLGRESYVKERTVRRKTQESHRFTDFRLRKQDVLSQRRVEADFRKSQRACEQLDSAKVCTVLSLSLFLLSFPLHS